MLKHHRCLVSVRLIAAHLRAPIVVTSRVMLPFLAPMVRERTQPQNLGSSDSVTFLQTLFRKKTISKLSLKVNNNWTPTIIHHTTQGSRRRQPQSSASQRILALLNIFVFMFISPPSLVQFLVKSLEFSSFFISVESSRPKYHNIN